jgi:alpha-1,2-mannosyltransferase
LPLGLAIGLAAAIKLTPLIFVPYLLMTRRARGALYAVITFIACEAIAFLITPRASWTYWTKDVFDSKRAGALLYTSDQNLSSVLERFHHGPVSAFVLVPALVLIGVGGLALAAWAHRRSSIMLGLLVCATTGLLISPITWVHHMVWVVPVIIWLAAGTDRPSRGPLLAGFAVVLFVAAPIWWYPGRGRSPHTRRSCIRTIGSSSSATPSSSPCSPSWGASQSCSCGAAVSCFGGHLLQLCSFTRFRSVLESPGVGLVTRTAGNRVLVVSDLR